VNIKHIHPTTTILMATLQSAASSTLADDP